MGQAKREEKIISCAFGLSIDATLAMPSVKLRAVSNDSANRNCKPCFTLKRSMTTSMVCFLFFSRLGASSKSHNVPLIRALMYPWLRNSSRVCKCSPLRFCTTGASSIKRWSGSWSNTKSTIWLTVWAANGRSCSGQRGSPARANNRRR